MRTETRDIIRAVIQVEIRSFYYQSIPTFTKGIFWQKSKRVRLKGYRLENKVFLLGKMTFNLLEETQKLRIFWPK